MARYDDPCMEIDSSSLQLTLGVSDELNIQMDPLEHLTSQIHMQESTHTDTQLLMIAYNSVTMP